MANENKEENSYQMDFYLGCDCNTEFKELNNVILRSKKIDNLAKKLNLIKDFRKNVFDVSIFELRYGRFKGLVYCGTIEEIENWFKEKGVEL